MRLKKKTIYELTDDKLGTFALTFDPVDPVRDSIIVKVNEDRATVGYLVSDPDSCEWYFGEWDEGKFYGFDQRKKGYAPKTRAEIEKLVKDYPGRVFWINLYDHGNSRYYRAGKALVEVERPGTEPAEEGLIIPDQEWDVSRGAALYVAPEDAPDPAGYCDSTMKEFSDWCNGYIYGVVTERYRKAPAGSWRQQEKLHDACWGHIGWDWAQQALREAIDEDSWWTKRNAREQARYREAQREKAVERLKNRPAE